MADALGKRRVAGVVVERGYPRMAGSGVIAGEVAGAPWPVISRRSEPKGRSAGQVLPSSR